MKRAGVKAWPKLFQNLRSTRETELADEFPVHVVCEWIGNTELIAAKHYLQVREEHFEAATADTPFRLTHKVTQQGDATGRNRTHPGGRGKRKDTTYDDTTG
jgi:hypothetical protein